MTCSFATTSGMPGSSGAVVEGVTSSGTPLPLVACGAMLTASVMVVMLTSCDAQKLSRFLYEYEINVQVEAIYCPGLRGGRRGQGFDFRPASASGV